MKTLPEAKQLIVNSVIRNIITDIENHDYTVLNELLLMLSTDALITSLPESEWVKNFKFANISKKQVDDFIKKYGIKVHAREKDDYVELMMDNHYCINWNNHQYYIPDVDDNAGIVEILSTYFIV